MKERLCLQLTDTLEMHKIGAIVAKSAFIHSDLACHQCTETTMGTLYCSSLSLANAILFLEAPRQSETEKLLNFRDRKSVV